LADELADESADGRFYQPSASGYEREIGERLARLRAAAEHPHGRGEGTKKGE
jgi:hypothetical protein